MRGGPSVASVPDAQVGQGWVDGSAGWVANEGIFDAVFAPVTSAILGAAAIEPGQRVLDVGCGTGTLLAAAVATGATAVGVDVSPGMVEAARRRVPSATVIVDDAETADILARAPGAAFDRVVSRFGVMFFPDPVAAFTNLRRATAPGSRLVFACWRAKEDNPMFTLGTSVLEERLNPRPTPPPPGTPGADVARRPRPAGVGPRRRRLDVGGPRPPRRGPGLRDDGRKWCGGAAGHGPRRLDRYLSLWRRVPPWVVVGGF